MCTQLHQHHRRAPSWCRSGQSLQTSWPIASRAHSLALRSTGRRAMRLWLSRASTRGTQRFLSRSEGNSGNKQATEVSTPGCAHDAAAGGRQAATAAHAQERVQMGAWADRAIAFDHRTDRRRAGSDPVLAGVWVRGPTWQMSRARSRGRALTSAKEGSTGTALRGRTSGAGARRVERRNHTKRSNPSCGPTCRRG